MSIVPSTLRLGPIICRMIFIACLPAMFFINNADMATIQREPHGEN